MDTIRVRGILCHGYHGVLSAERTLGQQFVVHLDLYLDTKPAAATDAVDETVNYAAVYADVKEIVEGPAKNLLETVAEDIARTLLAKYPLLHGVACEIEKPSAPIPGPFATVAVRIERWRSV